jgi:hypothetical protein
MPGRHHRNAQSFRTRRDTSSEFKNFHGCDESRRRTAYLRTCP